MQSRPRVAVVGGGVSGLAAAWRLREHADVVVLEQTGLVGGKLRVETVGGVTVDVGAESMLARRPEGVALVRQAGLDAAIVHPATTAANVVRDGRLHPLPAATVMGVPSDPSTLTGLLTPDEVARVLAEPSDDMAPDDEAHDQGAVDHEAADHEGPEDLAVAAWVGGRLGDAVVDRVVEPLLGGVYAGHSHLLSARATLPALWARAHAGGGPRSLVAAARATLAAGAPGRPVFAGVRGGVGLLPLALAEGLARDGVSVRTGVTVRRVERTAAGWRLTLGPVPSPEYLDVDAVVLAVPAAPAARLLADESPYAAADLAGVETASVAVVACVVARSALAGLPGSGVLVPPVEGRPVKAMTFSSAKWQWLDEASRDDVVVRLSLGRHREEAVLQRDDDELTALAVADAADLLGRPLTPRATRVVRWGGSLPQYAVGHVERVARVRSEVAKLAGLAVCGAVMDGVGIPACVAAADAAVAKVLADLRARPA